MDRIVSESCVTEGKVIKAKMNTSNIKLRKKTFCLHPYSFENMSSRK